MHLSSWVVVACLYLMPFHYKKCSVYGQGGKLEKAIEMFNTAQDSGLTIDEKAYTNMISFYGKAGGLLFSPPSNYGS